jgi:hypothetical protein
MRQIAESELMIVQCGIHGGGVGLIVENTLKGLVIGAVFPGIANALQLTAVVTNPILATGALFGMYAIADIIAVSINCVVFK